MAIVAPSTGDQFYSFSSAQDMQDTVQARMDKGLMTMLSPDMDLRAKTPISLRVRNGGGSWFGIAGNGARVSWDGGLNGDVDLLSVTSDVASECLAIRDLSLYCGGYEGRQCRTGLAISSPRGLSIFRAAIRDVIATYANAAGMSLSGDFFESLVDAPQCASNFGSGLAIADLPNTLNGVISNVTVRTPNLSRNRGYGLELSDQANSVDVVSGGSFINNGKGGIFAATGIRYVGPINGENTGLSLINVPTVAFAMRLSGCNLSSNGITREPTNGKPSRYVLNCGDMNGVTRWGLYYTPYPPDDQHPAPTNMRVLAPAGTPYS